MKNSRVRKTSYFIFLFVFLFCLSSLFLSVSFAAENSANIDVSCGKYQYPWCQESGGNPSGLIGQFYKIALGAVGACALGVLIYGSILWTVSGAVSTKQDAKEWISAALWGLALLLAAYLILYTINPDLVSIGKTGGGLEDLIKPIGKNSTGGSGSAGTQIFSGFNNIIPDFTEPINWEIIPNFGN